MVPGEQCSNLQRVEGMRHRRSRGLSRVSSAPLRFQDVKPQLADPSIQLVRPKPATSDMEVRRQEEYRPVLSSVGVLSLDFARKTLAHLLFAERAADESGHLGIAP